MLQQNKINSTSAVSKANEQVGKSTSKMATKFRVTMQKHQSTGQIDISYRWKSASNQHKYLSHSLLDLIADKFFEQEDDEMKTAGINVLGMTEITLNTKTYRAHPCYRNESPWFDWVLIAWNIHGRNHVLIYKEEAPLLRLTS